MHGKEKFSQSVNSVHNTVEILKLESYLNDTKNVLHFCSVQEMEKFHVEVAGSWKSYK